MAAVLLSITLVVFACAESGDDPSAPSLTVDEQIALGWAAFESGDLAGAEAAFRSALSAAPNNGEVFNGLGWSLARQLRLTEAVAAFDNSLDRGRSGPEPLAGRAIVKRDVDPPDYEGTIADAEAALVSDPNFVFSHDATLDWKDVLLLTAQAHFALGQYVEANDIVVQLGGTDANPLSPSFIENLLSEIATLGELLDG